MEQFHSNCKLRDLWAISVSPANDFYGSFYNVLRQVGLKKISTAQTHTVITTALLWLHCLSS